MSLFNVDKINLFITHFVGNKMKGEGLRFSGKIQDVNNVEKLLIKLIERNFSYDEKFKFKINDTQKNNPVFSMISTIFNDDNSFLEQSKLIARYLYEKSDHPQIKSGELCVGKCEKLIYKEMSYPAVILIKSEIKDEFLKIVSIDDEIIIQPESGIGLDKIDKGCIIIKVENDFLIFLTNKLVDNNIKYWNNDFLNTTPINNDFLLTKSYLDSAKKVIFNTDFENNLQRVECLSKTINFFEENDFFEEDLYKKHLNNEKIFLKIKDFENSIGNQNVNNFKISQRIVNKNKRTMKKIIKLDNNFDILVKNDFSLIEKGRDNKGEFYKLYYKSES